jgi:hypothetical protein
MPGGRPRKRLPSPLLFPRRRKKSREETDLPSLSSCPCPYPCLSFPPSSPPPPPLPASRSQATTKMATATLILLCLRLSNCTVVITSDILRLLRANLAAAAILDFVFRHAVSISESTPLIASRLWHDKKGSVSLSATIRKHEIAKKLGGLFLWTLPRTLP